MRLSTPPVTHKSGVAAIFWLALFGCALMAFVWVASHKPRTTITDNFALLNIKPYGIPGVVNELNLSIWGTNSWRRGGDAYSPQYVARSTPNPEYPTMPYGYLYRV